MIISNLTPHKLNIYNEDSELVEVLEPSGIIARITTTKTLIDRNGLIPIFETTYENPEGLPPQQEGVIFVVSSLFRSFADRPDLHSPGELLRDSMGQPIGCIGLSR